MKRSLFFVSAFALLGLSAYAADSSCVKCHTDAATMKTLFVPPVLAASEGEG
jgi:hypothetical protein